MSIYSIVLVALSLAMDAFAVSITLGLTSNNNYNSIAVKAGLSFGLFQGGMAALGWALGCSLKRIIDPIDHWIAFLLLTAIGINFIKESKNSSSSLNSLSIDSLKVLLTLSLATSIDALATGVTFSLLNVNVFVAVCLIGQITYFASVVGVYVGKGLSKSTKLQSCVNILGGIILIMIGLKILITHLLGGT
ncbi:manganese efflux pump MntP family protein [Vallitalea sediminicola]